MIELILFILLPCVAGLYFIFVLGRISLGPSVTPERTAKVRKMYKIYGMVFLVFGVLMILITLSSWLHHGR
ncbi:MAG: hypothetical protein ABSA12_10685 [Verrucomicrobiia bacterium]|jgi:hypothetical protein